ncbi:MAG TPA: hypothetical protein DEF41_06985 [Desulfovibrio sp.]|uniref:Uncharacterized protein n=1 Tax=Nitratidesulfovibrio vulgaris (strain ATCC 29579 / DSM 644 / CCUG 34227 / NCIMB 8303 / VKM B-1760 / Hildenborough) TaxID=882 RepID=Q72C45_NITV2|nr:hypothetical protein DVU_1439 [Nitratidesulfovibrio vulgaris str. Hildenborough]HBW15870.1 hypothetical protein [Desulfovibrio sp.]
MTCCGNAPHTARRYVANLLPMPYDDIMDNHQFSLAFRWYFRSKSQGLAAL